MLKEPPQYFRVREIKEWYVEFLMKMHALERGGGSRGHNSAPLLVALFPKRNSDLKNLNTYHITRYVLATFIYSKINEVIK